MTDGCDQANADLRRLVEKVIDSSARQPLGTYTFGSDEPGSELARHVERVVFAEAFGNSPDLLREQYTPYEESSIFFCVVDHRRHLPAGAMRIILPVPHGPGLRSLTNIELHWGESPDSLFERNGLPYDPAGMWDVSSLAVMPEYTRGANAGLVTLGLAQGLAMTSDRCGVEWGVAILHLPVFRMLHQKLHGAFQRFEGVPDRSYLGSPANVPSWAHSPSWRQRLREEDQTLHALLFEGTGLEYALRRVDVDRAEHLIDDVYTVKRRASP
jgi:hypothetical protein